VSDPKLTKEEFCARFKAHMLKFGGDKFDDGSSVAKYADENAPSYFDGYYAEEPPRRPRRSASSSATAVAATSTGR
jgi:hypothetical protein